MEYWIIRDVSDKEPQEIAIKLPIALNANEAAKAIEYGNTLKSKSKPPFITIAAIMKNIISSIFIRPFLSIFLINAKVESIAYRAEVQIIKRADIIARATLVYVGYR